MTLRDIRDYIKTLNIGEVVYMGRMDTKKDKSIGVYASKHANQYKVALGGPQNASYETKYVTLLVHWNKSPTETEEAATRLFKAVAATRNGPINNKIIKFAQPLYELQDVGTDEEGIFEMVIDVAFICEKEV